MGPVDPSFVMHEIFGHFAAAFDHHIHDPPHDRVHSLETFLKLIAGHGVDHGFLDGDGVCHVGLVVKQRHFPLRPYPPVSESRRYTGLEKEKSQARAGLCPAGHASAADVGIDALGAMAALALVEGGRRVRAAARGRR